MENIKQEPFTLKTTENTTLFETTEQLNVDNIDYPINTSYIYPQEDVLNILKDMEHEVKKLTTLALENVEALSKLDQRINLILAQQTSALIPLVPNNPFETNKTFFNELARWIHLALMNQLSEGLSWDFKKRFDSIENMLVTNKVIASVSIQITSKTKRVWTDTLSYMQLYKKVSSVFRRRRDKQNLSPTKKLLVLKKNARKTRRVTKCKHRNAILAHEEYGQEIRDLYGYDVEALLIEQLQSDEESTDSEMGETVKTKELRVIKPSWRTERADELFRKFDEYDLLMRRSCSIEKDRRYPGRRKDVDIKMQYIERAPAWARVKNLESYKNN